MDSASDIPLNQPNESLTLFLVAGWPTPLKNDGVKVSWDDDIPNIWKNNPSMFQTTNQTLITINQHH